MTSDHLQFGFKKNSNRTNSLVAVNESIIFNKEVVDLRCTVASWILAKHLTLSCIVVPLRDY